MLLQQATRLAVLLAASTALALPAFAAPKAMCPAGQTKLQGKCVAACSATSPFSSPDACECPAGYGKILTGDGSGKCDRLRCPTNSPFDAKLACECPAPFKKTTAKKGEVRCEQPKAAKAHAAR